MGKYLFHIFQATYLFLVIKVLLVGGSNSECAESFLTAKDVKRCPRDKVEWNRRSKLMDCDKIKSNYKSCINVTYHCLMNEHRNKTLEVCALPIYLQGYCAIYNEYEKKIKNDYRRECTSMTEKCPVRYHSTNASQYQSCYIESNAESSIRANDSTRWSLLLLLLLAIPVLYFFCVLYIHFSKGEPLRKAFCVHRYFQCSGEKKNENKKDVEDPLVPKPGEKKDENKKDVADSSVPKPGTHGIDPSGVELSYEELRQSQLEVCELKHVVTNLCGEGRLHAVENNISNMEIEMNLIENKSSNVFLKVNDLKEEYQKIKDRINELKEKTKDLGFAIFEYTGTPIEEMNGGMVESKVTVKEVSNDNPGQGAHFIKKINGEESLDDQESCSLGIPEFKDSVPISHPGNYDGLGVHFMDMNGDEQYPDGQESHLSEYTSEEKGKNHEQMTIKVSKKVQLDEDSYGKQREEGCWDTDKDSDPKKQKFPGRLANLEAEVMEHKKEIDTLTNAIQKVIGKGKLFDIEKTIKKLNQDVTQLERQIDKNETEPELRLQDCEKRVDELRKRINTCAGKQRDW